MKIGRCSRSAVEGSSQWSLLLPRRKMKINRQSFPCFLFSLTLNDFFFKKKEKKRKEKKRKEKKRKEKKRKEKKKKETKKNSSSSHKLLHRTLETFLSTPKLSSFSIMKKAWFELLFGPLPWMFIKVSFNPHPVHSILPHFFRFPFFSSFIFSGKR